jgi:hypothetical protein
MNRDNQEEEVFKNLELKVAGITEMLKELMALSAIGKQNTQLETNSEVITVEHETVPQKVSKLRFCSHDGVMYWSGRTRKCS